jgi:hypothetical protein
MSVILRPRTAHSLGTARNRTGRELAALVTCGAVVLVLVLAAAIPVAAEKALVAGNATTIMPENPGN